MRKTVETNSQLRLKVSFHNFQNFSIIFDVEDIKPSKCHVDGYKSAWNWKKLKHKAVSHAVYLSYGQRQNSN